MIITMDTTLEHVANYSRNMLHCAIPDDNL